MIKIKFRIEKVLEILIECTYLGAIFLVPLYFSIIPKTSNVFELNKIVLFRILVLVLFLFCFIYFLTQGRAKKELSIFFKSKAKHLIIPLSYLLGLLILTFFSISRQNSFWGNYDYQLGFINYCYFFIFYFLLVLWINRKEQLSRVLATIACSSFFVCAYGIIQFAGVDPFKWFESTGGRIFSTLGQPNYLASYLLLVLPISGFLYIENKKKYFKIFYFIIFLMQLVCLTLTYSRGGQLALLSGIFLFFIFFLFRQEKNCFLLKYKKRTLFLFFLLIILGAFLFWLIIPDNQKSRIRLMFDFRQGSTASRVDYYGAGWKGFKKSPLFGYGLGSQRDVMAGYYEKDWAIFNNVNTIPSQAHNIILDYLLVGGIFGLALFLLLNYYFVNLAIENIITNKFSRLSWLVLFAFVCYTISLFFGFVVVVTEIYFWLFLAILVISNSLIFDNAEDVLEIKKSTKKIIAFKFVVISVVSFGIFYQIHKELNIIIADHYFYKLESALNQEQYFEAFVFYDWMNELGVRMEHYDMKFANYLVEKIEVDNQEIWAEAAKRIIFPKIIGRIKDNSYETVCVRAKMYSEMASKKKPVYFKNANDDFIDCLNRGKNIPDNYRVYAKYFLKKGEYDKSIEKLNIFFTKLPDLQDERINNDHAEAVRGGRYLADILFGDTYVKMKNFEIARGYYLQANKEFYNAIVVNKKIADSYYLEGEKEKAIEFLKENNRVDSENYFWNFLIAQVYLEINEKTKAIEYTQKSLLLSPDNQQVKDYLASLISS